MSDELYYTTLEREASDSFEEKKSVFIGAAKHIADEQEALDFIAAKKREYSDATHNVWAYYLKNGATARYSDDGEPQGTGGVPVLDTIKKSGVTDAVVVVTRYFGGTLLGAGGLVRAYSKGASVAIAAAHIVTYEHYSEYQLICSYSDYQRFQVELPKFGAVTDSADFAENVIIRFAVKDRVSADLCARIREMCAGKENLQKIGTRFDFK